MNYYHNLITEKSWSLLKRLKKDYGFILIGGWAVYLHTNALKSKDIDFVCEYSELEKIRNNFDLGKNDRLKKYEARIGEVEIDIYVPFYSNPGLPAEILSKYKISLGGFEVVRKEILAILKQKALKERADSVKGRKDLIDLISLFALEGFDWNFYKKTCFDNKVEEYMFFALEKIKKTTEIDELNLNVHKFARLKSRMILVKSGD